MTTMLLWVIWFTGILGLRFELPCVILLAKSIWRLAVCSHVLVLWRFVHHAALLREWRRLRG